MDNTAEEETDNVLPFKAITGGKGGPPGNWLLDMPEGTTFLAKDTTTKNSPLQPFFVLNKFSPRSILLKVHYAEQLTWWDPVDFVARFTRQDILDDGIAREPPAD